MKERDMLPKRKAYMKYRKGLMKSNLLSVIEHLLILAVCIGFLVWTYIELF